MCDNSAYKASALRPCKNQSANAEPAVSECVHGVRRSPNCQRTQCSISSLNVKNSSDGVASSISQRHTSAAKLMYQYYGLLDLGTMLGMFCFKTCDLRRKIS